MTFDRVIGRLDEETPYLLWQVGSEEVLPELTSDFVILPEMWHVDVGPLYSVDPESTVADLSRLGLDAGFVPP